MEKDLSHQAILGKTLQPVDFDEVAANGYKIVDVRTPEEFASGTIPGAISIPLFDGDERSVIGTLYRHGGQPQAIDKGFEFVSGKIFGLLAGFEPLRETPFVVFCARGGMRSRSVVNLLTQSGYTVFQLKGGYKEYRNIVLDRLENFQPRLIVIHGLTGTGKTRIIEQLDHAIDLEGLARHRSSLFGGLDREPSNQRTFESELMKVVSFLGNEPYFIEGESRKIGRVFTPKPLAMAMKSGVLVCVHCSMETRIRRIIEDYPVTDAKILQQIETILKSLKQKMGTGLVEKMCQLLKNGELDELVRILLVDYYDKRYSKSMSSYKYSAQFSSEDIAEAAKSFARMRSDLMSVRS